MMTTRSLVMLAAVVASLLACGAPGSRGEPAPVLGPYAAARTGIVPVVRPEAASLQDAHAGALMMRETTRRMCELRGGKGSC